jgi:hypothetical protein
MAASQPQLRSTPGLHVAIRRGQRHMTDIKHISGQDNVVTDALSRVESVTAPPSYDSLAASQDGDDELQTLLGSTTDLRLEKLPIPGTTVSIYCDTSAGRPRPYVPGPLRLQVFQSVYVLSHLGTEATAKLVAQCLVWPGVRKDCRTWALTCQPCQHAKVSRHMVTPLGNFMTPAARFLHVHIDVNIVATDSVFIRCCGKFPHTLSIHYKNISVTNHFKAFTLDLLYLTV